MAKKALLMILDGWGIGKHGEGDVIFNTPTPYLDYLNAVSPHSQLQASGEDVGLPDGQMGNSEVGHLNIGAGRIVYQDLVKINRACKDGSILENPEIKNAYGYAQKTGKKLHLMGLTSDGGVHSSLDHLFKLIEISKEYGLKETYVHCFMDGRDTDPKSGAGFIKQLEDVCAKNGAHVASIVGRFYAMDRDKRWNRVKEAYDLLVEGKGKQADDMVKAMEESYADGVTDEFIKPINNSTVDGTIQEGDVVIFINFRNDRAKELTQQAGLETAAFCRDGEVRSRYVLLQRRTRGTVRRRGPHTRSLSQSRYIRPQTGNERIRGEGQARGRHQHPGVRLHRCKLR